MLRPPIAFGVFHATFFQLSLHVYFLRGPATMWPTIILAEDPGSHIRWDLLLRFLPPYTTSRLTGSCIPRGPAPVWPTIVLADDPGSHIRWDLLFRFTPLSCPILIIYDAASAHLALFGIARTGVVVLLVVNFDLSVL